MGYSNLENAFQYKSPLLRAQLDALAENDQFLKNNHWQDGAKTTFHQASVPLGWTLSSYSVNHWLRVVSGIGGGSGGSHLASSSINFIHTHVAAADPGHSHKVLSHYHDLEPFTTAAVVIGISDTVVMGHGDEDLRWATSGGSNIVEQSKSRMEPVVSDDSDVQGGHAHTLNNFGSNYQLAYADIIIGEKDFLAGYTDMTNYFQVDQKIDFEPFYDDLRGNDEYNRARISFGARHIMFNATPPVGWLKVNVSSNGYALRTAGVGAGLQAGTLINSTLFFSHEHTNNFAGAHTHLTPNHRHDLLYFNRNNFENLENYVGNSGGKVAPLNDAGGSHLIYRGRSANGGGGGSTGIAGNHIHFDTAIVLLNVQFAYVDVIQVEKLSTGAPYVFSTHPETIDFKKLVSKQRLQAMARNDAYLKYHCHWPGAVMFFNQPTAPIHWTQLVTHNDKFLRFNNTAGGGFGGSKGLATVLALEHTHNWDTFNHQHSIPSHVHALESRVEVSGTPFLSGGVVPYFMATKASFTPLTGTDNYAYVGEESSPAPTFGFPAKPTTLDQGAATTDTKGHSHAITPAGADIELAYVDVIMCQKE